MQLLTLQVMAPVVAFLASRNVRQAGSAHGIIGLMAANAEQSTGTCRHAQSASMGR
jgi:uncharacterized protein with PhoU and TrkA domain